MRATEANEVLRQGTRGHLGQALLLAMGPATAQLVLAIAFSALPPALGGLYAMLSVPIVLMQLLASVCFLGLVNERIRSTAAGLNELPDAGWSTLPSHLKEGLRGLAAALLVPLPFLAAGLFLFALTGVGNLAALLAPLGVEPSQALGLSGMAAVLVGTFGTMLVVVGAYVTVPAMYIHGVVKGSALAALNPVAALKHAVRGRRNYLAAAFLTLALSGIFSLLGAMTAGLGTMVAGGGTAGLGQGMASVLVVLLGYLYATGSYAATLLYVANWMGQYAYVAYEGEVERRVIHEDVEALDEDEMASLATGVVATLEKVRLAGSPLLYEEGEYRLPALQHKSVSKAVLRDLDVRGKLAWRDPLHRRNVMGG